MLALHVWLAGHVLPHPPQLPGFAVVSMHEPLQYVVPLPAGHVQTPATQLEPFPHVTPHPPQFALSVCSSTHARLHEVRPAPHVAEHEPAEHTSGAAHVVAQEPQ